MFVLRTATVLMVVCPISDETRNLISTKELAQMRQSAVIINVGRGGVVNEEALAEALQSRQIAGAASDVFVKEPAGVDESPLLRLPQDVNFIASPHVAWCSELTMSNTYKALEDNVNDYMKGQPQNVVV